MIARLPVRLRLTLVFAVAMAMVLTGLGGFLTLRLRAKLDEAIADRLGAATTELSSLTREEAGDLDHPGDRPLADMGGPYAEILSSSGRRLDVSPRLRPVHLLDPAKVGQVLSSGEVTFDRAEGSGVAEPLRVRATRLPTDHGVLLVVAGVSLEDREEAIESLAALLLLGGPVALLLASGAGYTVAAGALRPVEAMRRSAASVSVEEPGRRLPVPPARDELRRLGHTLNDMLERQEVAFARERTFVADASHELRTPLAILKAELELALGPGRSADELLAAIRSASEETERLARLAEDLLVIARSDQGRLPVRTEAVAAAPFLAEQRRLLAPRLAQEGRAVVVEMGEELELWIDPLRLQQALGNLLDNAVRHGGGTIVLSAQRDGPDARLSVADSGPGFPAGFLPSAFERFARGDGGRSSRGAGLGLAIVAVVARAHSGRVGARNRPEGGAEVWLSVPIAADDRVPGAEGAPHSDVARR